MKTLGYVLILLALLIIRGVTKGRGITELPKDLGDIFIALVSSDTAAMTEVLGRTGDANTATPVAPTAPVSGGKPDVTITPETGGADKAGLMAFGKFLRSTGYDVAEGPAPFGPIHRVHAPNSQHYIDEALDINADTGFRGGEMAALDNVALMAKAKGFSYIWRNVGHNPGGGTYKATRHMDHLHLAVPPSLSKRK